MEIFNLKNLPDTEDAPEQSQPVLRLTPMQHARFMLAIERIEVRQAGKKDIHYRGGTLPDGTLAGLDPSFEPDAADGTVAITTTTNSSTSNFLRKDVKAAANVLSIFKSACHLLPEFDGITRSAPREVKRVAPTLGRPPSPIPYDGSEPKLAFKVKFLGQDKLAPGALTNMLVTGATGSGKTVSSVFTMQDTLLSYKLNCGRHASVLIIDPKFELLDRARKLLANQRQLERLVVVGESPPLQYFSDGDGHSLRDRYAAILSFLPFNNEGGDAARWQHKSDQMTRDLLAMDQEFLDATGLPLLESVLTVAKLTDHGEIGQWPALLLLYQLGMSSECELRLLVDVMEVLWVLAGLPVKPLPLARYVGMEHGAEQFFYLARLGCVVAEIPASTQIKELIDFDTRLGLKKPQTVSIQHIVNTGAVLVYQPSSSDAHDVVGKAVKTLFLAAVFKRADMLRPIGYLCDEAHRWITADKVTGEANFLDRCRAYRVVSVLATQSIPSLLGAMDARYDKSSALASILANTPTKLMFRNTDPTTVNLMKSFIPGSPVAGIHVLEARPPATLRTGEYYYLVGSEWGRALHQLGTRSWQVT